NRFAHRAMGTAMLDPTRKRPDRNRRIGAMRALAVVALTICACTEKNPDFCASDEDCAGTPMPFCDVNGEFPESNGSNHICIPTPADCPVERCGCVAGTALACDLDELVVCGEDGTSTV